MATSLIDRSKFSTTGSDSGLPSFESINPGLSYAAPDLQLGGPPSSVSGALRQYSPQADTSLLDSETASGPLQVPRPPELQAPSVKEIMKRNLVGMIPLVGPAIRQGMEGKERIAAEEWQRQQEYENALYERRAKIMDPALTDDLKKQAETQRKVQAAHWLKSQFPNVTDAMMESWLTQAYGFDPDKQENVFVAVPWSADPVPALQNDLGEIRYRGQDGRPTVGTPDGDANILRVLRPQDMGEARDVKWQSDRDQKFAFYNEKVLGAPQGYQPTALDYANAERYWKESAEQDPTTTGAMWRRWVDLRTKAGLSEEAAIREYQQMTAPTTVIQQGEGLYSYNPRQPNAPLQPIMMPGDKPGELVQAPLPPTTEMRNRDQARQDVALGMSQLKDLSGRIFVHSNSAMQRAEASARAVKAWTVGDPEFRTYQDARMALAANFAVLQQGSRPSDTDVMKVWAPFIPDPFSDTKESAEMKWGFIQALSSVDPKKLGKTAAVKMKNGETRQVERDKLTGFLKENDGATFVPVIVQQHPTTGAIRHSFDGGATWNEGTP